MANLNSVEGMVHVELDRNGTSWGGYILVDPDPDTVKYFEFSKASSRNIDYNGPLFRNGVYYVVRGKVRIIQIFYSSTKFELRVEFEGIEPLTEFITLKGKPEDYIP